MITTEQFENRLIEYLDGELSDAERREVEEYLQAHPEDMDLKGDFSLLSAAGKSIRESTFPARFALGSQPQAPPLVWPIRVKSMWLPPPRRVQQWLAGGPSPAGPCCRTGDGGSVRPYSPPHSPRWRSS